MFCRDPESAPLAERVVDDPFVPAENMSPGVNKISRRAFTAGVSLNKTGIVAVGNETNILAVVLLCIYKIFLGGDFPGPLLILIPRR